VPVCEGGFACPGRQGRARGLRYAGALVALLCALLACSEDSGRPGRTRTDAGGPARSDAAIRLGVPRFHLPQRPGAALGGPDAAAHARDGAASDATSDADPDPAAELRARGEYLVRHVAGCMECHTPRRRSGAFDESRLLSGVESLIDLEPADDARGLIHSRNLTPDETTGLGKWSDEQIKRAFQEGIDSEQKVLHWTMPYWIFANMRDADADAIVAYLRALPAVAHEVPVNQPNAIDTSDRYDAYLLPRAIAHSTLERAHPGYESAQRGRYLAGGVAPCLLCHTPPDPDDPGVPIDFARAFSGRRAMEGVKLGTALEGDERPPLIESFNLTPHENGIGGWSAQDLANLLRHGVAPTGLPVCDPMPSYFGGTFRGLSEQDALDLGHYFTTIPAQDSGVIPSCCTACHRDAMDADAG
jgi:mono/diheme cytochrome c family protein